MILKVKSIVLWLSFVSTSISLQTGSVPFLASEFGEPIGDVFVTSVECENGIQNSLDECVVDEVNYVVVGDKVIVLENDGSTDQCNHTKGVGVRCIGKL